MNSPHHLGRSVWIFEGQGYDIDEAIGWETKAPGGYMGSLLS